MFWVDETTASQTASGYDPVLMRSPGRAEVHVFEWYPHGTLARYGALNTKTGEVSGKTTVRDVLEQIVAFVGDVVAPQPAGPEVDLIPDTVRGPKAKRVEAFLSGHPTVRALSRGPTRVAHAYSMTR